ncbi:MULTISPECIES: DUF397 domain-containing protein [unclassified Streptomyces]|uniref:DUF397 domain-containing protein n=1 Tax=unclassified Streptomyces TaxID=2593676 RepID=UPI000378D402|nr:MULTISPECIES: DUF397 domain-containing protein [unclassified Streptomyces]MYT33001.1 DUF397 domain-containing protein [Streptomyces sp. SID8354]
MTDKPSAGTASKLEWFKSSYSSGNERDDCIEVAWAKSSYSSSSDINDCIEVASTSATIHIRDSKDADGPHLHVPPGVWADFVAFARR